MVSSIATTNTASTSAATAGSSSNISTTKSQFLQLLLAQLQNQDPLSPADTDQMTAQMMQLGQLEQLFNLNENTEKMMNMQSSAMIATYSGMVGKTAVTGGSTFQLVEGSSSPICFELDQVPNATTIRVFDQYNNLVREFHPTITTTGLQSVAFDGKDSNGNSLTGGYYNFTVEASDSADKAILPTTYSVGAISSIRIENGSPVFQLGRTDVGVSDIIKLF